jgi:membrane protein implicated in regulation of membrane protease activity
MNFFDPSIAPFSIALTIMGLIVALEVVGLLFGAAFSELVDAALPDVDADFDLDGGDAVGKLLAWLYVGKVPALILLAVFLAAFGLVGLAVQNAAFTAFGAPAPLFIAAPLAFVASMPVTRFVAAAVSRILPREESDAVSAETFIGRIATVIRGEARRGTPAEAKVADGKGLTHYILVEPEDAQSSFREGAEVLLTAQSGAVFRAIINTNLSLSQSATGDAHV